VRKLLLHSTRQACYLSFLADDEDSYAVAVAATGDPRSVRLPFGRNHLAAAVQEFTFLTDGEPGSRIRPAGIDPDNPFETEYGPVLQILTPLARWLASLLDEGMLQ